MIKPGGRAMYEAEALFRILLELLGDGDEEFVLWEHVI